MAASLRPLSLGELLDHTFSLYRRHFLLFVGIMAIPQLFLLAINTVVTGLSQSTGALSSNPATALAATAIIGLGTLVGLVAYVGTYAVSLAATVFAVSDIYLGRETTVREAYGRVRGKFWRVIDVLLSVGVRVMIGFLLLIIPGIILMIRYAVSMPASMIENLKARDAMRRSTTLVEGSAGKVLAISFLMTILTYIALALFQFPFAFAAQMFVLRGEPAPWLSIMQHVGEFAANTLAGPLYSIATVLLYYDQRVRKEAFDLELMMSTIDGTPPPSPAAEVEEPAGVVPRQLS